MYIDSVTMQYIKINLNKHNTYCRRGRQYGLNRSVCRQNSWYGRRHTEPPHGNFIFKNEGFQCKKIAICSYRRVSYWKLITIKHKTQFLLYFVCFREKRGAGEGDPKHFSKLRPREISHFQTWEKHTKTPKKQKAEIFFFSI